MQGETIYDLAWIASFTVQSEIRNRSECRTNPSLYLRGSLLWAFMANEIEMGASKESLLQFVSKVYDLLDEQKESLVRSSTD